MHVWGHAREIEQFGEWENLEELFTIINPPDTKKL